MPNLQIDLQEGFDSESVTIQVDGREVFKNPDVTTKLQIGLADRVELEVAEGSAEVQINLPSRKTATSVSLSITDSAKYLGVSLDSEGAISHKLSDQPFRYL